MKEVAKETFDYPDYWPVEEYDDDAMTITTEDEILKTNDDAVEFIKELDGQLKKIAYSAEEEKIKKFFLSIRFSVDGETEFISDGTIIDFRIERNENGNITYKECYVDWEDGELDPDDEEFNPDDEGKFNSAIDIDDYMEEGAFSFGPKEVEAYFRAHGFEFSMEKYNALTMDDMCDILDGTYEPDKR